MKLVITRNYIVKLYLLSSFSLLLTHWRVDFFWCLCSGDCSFLGYRYFKKSYSGIREKSTRLKSMPHGGPDFFLLCLSNFISLKVNDPRADSRLKSTPQGQSNEIAIQRKVRIKDGRAVFFSSKFR